MLDDIEAHGGVRVVVFRSGDSDFFISHVDLERIAEYTAVAATSGGPDDSSLGAGALLVKADQRCETRKLRQQHAPEVGRLLAASNRWRQATADRNDYCHLLEAVLNLEGGIHWAEDLIWGIVSEEYELECPDPDGCAAVWVITGEQGFFSSSEDHALSDDAEILPLHPAAPPLPSLWLRNGATGLRVRHDFPPLLRLMIRGVVSPGPEASTDR